MVLFGTQELELAMAFVLKLTYLHISTLPFQNGWLCMYTNKTILI